MSDIGILRPIEDAELEQMRAWRNAPGVRKNMYTRHEISADEHRDWWARVAQREDQRYFMYEFGGVPTGIVGFTAIDRANGNASWAFYASPDATRGTGSRMELLALDHAFSVLKLHKLYCEVLAFNEAVIRLHQKFGFKVEGIFRQHHRVGEDFIDIYRLGLLESEWDQKRDDMLATLRSRGGNC